jgi:uncharacterized protein
VKPLNYISEALYVIKTSGKGRGVYTRTDLPADTLIEIAPVIVMGAKDRIHLDQTLLHDYIFEWGESRQQCCMALGYVPLYNHSYAANCGYEMNFRKQTIRVRTVSAVAAGGELTINYNGDWDSKKKVWFDAR